MKLNDDLLVLELRADLGVPSVIHPVVILDPERGHTLVDTGMPGMVGVSGAQVWALEREVPLLQGDEWPQKRPPQQRIDAMLADPNTPPHIQAFLRLPPITLRVDRALRDGEVLPLAGGVRALATPGHTHGHLSVYLERTGTLITGDALTSDAGQLRPPSERATPDLWAAGQSVGRLAGLDVQTIVTYHGGVVREDASGQLRRVAAEMAGA